MKLSEDKVKTVLVDITKLGLVEITRMKKNPPLLGACLVITCFLTILYDKLYIVIIFNTKERDKNEKTSKSI